VVRACLIVPALAAVACTVKIDAGVGFRCDDGVSCPAGQSCVGGRCLDPALDDGGLASDVGPADAAVGVDPPWWDAAWAFRRRLTIRNGSDAALPTGYELRWYYDFTPMAAPPSDPLRIVRWDGSSWSEKDRVLDDFADMAQLEEQFFWNLDEELPAGATNEEYWLYFDNPNAGPAPSDGDVVFPIFLERFGGTAIDTGRWAVSGTPTVADSQLALAPGQSVRSTITWGPGHAVDIKERRPQAAGDAWAGFQRTADFNDAAPWMLWIDWDGDGGVTPDSDLPAIGDTEGVTGPAKLPGTAERVYTIERHADRVVYGYEGLVHDERQLPSTFQDLLQLRLNNGSAATTVYYQAVRVRRIVYPEPVITVASPEIRPE
jgi:hypothetical protein